MEEILTQAFSTGDIKIVLAALILYAIIYLQRKDTKKHRDTARCSGCQIAGFKDLSAAQAW